MARKSKSKQPRMRNPVETRAKLMRATMELVTEKGAAALSLKEAARRAKVSRGVAYLHFEDREQLLNEAKRWISEGLQDGVKRFESDASLHDRTFYTTKLVLDHPEASQLMITGAMAGADLDRQHPLYKLLLGMLRDFKGTGKAPADLDVEVLTYIMFGSIASTLIFGAQHKGDDVDRLAERFTNEWIRILQEGIFVHGPKRPAGNGQRKRKAARRG
jgi:AcrR family transcriptional regulator